MSVKQQIVQRLAEQKQWIEEHGGDLAGYKARYGDPGVLCSTGPRAGKPMYGEGGTAIYNADVAELQRLERTASIYCRS